MARRRHRHDPDQEGAAKKDGKLLTPAGRLIMQGLIRGLESQRLPPERLLTNVTKADRQRSQAQEDQQDRGAPDARDRQRGRRRGEQAQKADPQLPERAGQPRSPAGSKSRVRPVSHHGPERVRAVGGSAAAVKAAQGIVARMRAFAAKLASLLKAGMPTALVQEIAGYGSVEGRTRVADVFLKASKSRWPRSVRPTPACRSTPMPPAR